MTQPENAFKTLYDIIVRLRSPGGCPWDREQDPVSLRANLMEETFECIEAINEKNPVHIQEELGDIFLLAAMLSYIHEEAGLFSTTDVLQSVSEKLIRRHPHVFGETKVANSDEVIDNWTKIKIEQEGRKPKDSLLDELSGALPPLDRAWKLQRKAAAAGFDWPNAEGVIEKIREELGEVVECKCSENIEEELGDLLFSVINLCRYLNVEPSLALHRTNSKFINRFKYVEKKMKESGQEMKQDNLELMDKYWEEAKNF